MKIKKIRLNKKQALLFLILWAIGFSCFSCSVFSPLPESDPAALAMLDTVKQTNKGLISCRGKGWLKATSEGKTTTYRMAWVISAPDKLRITLLSSGYPVETIVANGEKLSLISHTGKHARYTIQGENPSLEKLLSIKVTVKDMILLFLGRMPISSYDTATLTQDNLQYKTVLLKKRFRDDYETLTINAHGMVLKLDRSTFSSEKPLFGIRFDNTHQIETFAVPFLVDIETDQQKQRLRVAITDYEANIPLDPDVFRLTDS